MTLKMKMTTQKFKNKEVTFTLCENNVPVPSYYRAINYVIYGSQNLIHRIMLHFKSILIFLIPTWKSLSTQLNQSDQWKSSCSETLLLPSTAGSC